MTLIFSVSIFQGHVRDYSNDADKLVTVGNKWLGDQDIITGEGADTEGAYICPSTRNKNVVQGALYHGEDRKVESGASLLMSAAKNMASVRPGSLRASPPRHTDKRCLIKTLA